MRLNILTLTWNGADKLKKLIPTMNASLPYCPVDEVIWYIRDNGSKDNTMEVLYSFPLDKFVFHAGHNRATFAEGVNCLWEASETKDEDFILLLNNDVMIKDPKSLAKMFELQKKTGADVVGGRLLYTGTNKLQHAGVIFSTRYNNLPYHFRPGEESDKNAQKDRYFQAVTAACCLVRGSAFNRIGGMDEGFKWAFDDIDMCLQIGSTGGSIAYCGGTTIYHEESASLKKNPVNKMFLNKNVERFRKKWTGKYKIDHDLYLKNPKYNEIK